MLAALPALAQYNANLYSVRPSGGAVGQVCFYETAANGSNKVCLSAAASLAGDATFKLPTADGSAGQALTTDGSGQLSWSSVGTPPFSDANPILKDNLDATKELLFSIGGFTTATQRTVTVPDASFIMAGRNVDNAFSALQSFMASIDAAPSGGSGDYIKTRVLRIYQDTSTTVNWFFETPSSNTFRLKANDAKPALTFDSGTSPGFMILADNTATSGIAFHFIPGSTSGVQDLGASSTPWRTAYLKTSLIHNGTTRIDSSGNGNFASLQIGGGTIINSSSRWGSDLMPSVDNTHALGGPSLRWASANIENLTVASCTGCGGTNYWTRSGTDVRPATDGDDIVGRTGAGTQTHRLRASDGAVLSGSIYTGASPTWTQRIDASGNVTALSLTVNGTYFISSAGAALLGTVSLGDIYQSGPTVRLSSGGVFNGASFNVAGTEVISSGRVFKPVSLDVNGTANVIDSSRNATFTGLTFGASSALVQGSTTRISTAGKGTFVGVEFGGSSNLEQGGTTRIDTSGYGRFTGLYIGATQRIDSSGNMNTPAITIATSYSIGSGGTAILGSVFATDYWQGATSRISSSGVFNAASYQVATTSVIDSSRNTNFVNLKATGQLWFPYTDDNSWAIGDGGTNTTAKLAIYDTSGSFIGWVPVFP